MKKAILFLVLAQISLINYGQIVADHTVVDQYDKIPQQYIDKVKKMLVDIAGESHSSGYRIGMNLLELIDPRFQVQTYDGIRPSYSDQYLRLGKHGEVGEAVFYTTQAAINTYKSHITSQNNTGNPYSVMGFGWCWDMTWVNSPGGTKDPVYNVRWAGSSEGGPNGNLRWGLDSGDEVLTGNSVCMDTYLNAVAQYNQYCNDNGYQTKVIYTTGPVDGNSGSENGLQREIKHDYIRAHVAADNSRILFDYADILCWNNSGVENITSWVYGSDIRQHANIHPDNLADYDASWNLLPFTEDGDHIGEVGTLRLAKAMWWMLARIAGWDGSSNVTEVPLVEESGESKVAIEKGSGKININSLDKYVNGKVCFYNLNGVLIESKKIYDNLSYFDTSLLSEGLYFIVLSKDNFKEVKKIVLLRK